MPIAPLTDLPQSRAASVSARDRIVERSPRRLGLPAQQVTRLALEHLAKGGLAGSRPSAIRIEANVCLSLEREAERR